MKLYGKFVFTQLYKKQEIWAKLMWRVVAVVLPLWQSL